MIQQVGSTNSPCTDVLHYDPGDMESPDFLNSVVASLRVSLMKNVPSLISIILLFSAVAVLPAPPRPEPVERAALFDQPMKRVERFRLQQMLLSSFSQKNFDAAQQIAIRLTDLDPDDPNGWYNLACVQAVSGQTQSALSSLKRSVEKGFRDITRLQTDKDLESLRVESMFAEILEIAMTPYVPDHPVIPFQPGEIKNSVALVTEQNTGWSNERMSLITYFDPAPRSPISRDQIIGTSAAEVLVNAWIREGTAAGHYGDLYDNRDRDHSNLNLTKFPMLAHVEYSPEASKAEADWGMRIGQAFEQPTFGNSSTAQVNTPFWRSNPRMLMHDDMLMKIAWSQFVNNQLYCYPEHNDFDTTHGDVYVANTPFWIISQGSSGSDQPFLEAIALTLAAFHPDVKKTLVDNHILIAVLQKILRQSQMSILTDEDYLSGSAHPVVFQSERLDPLRMVRMAHEMTHETIPPLVRLKVVEEDLGLPGKDYFHSGPAEKLFDTPSAISRVFRSTAFQRRMVIDASDSVDVAARPMTFRWVVLQGDTERVHIRPLDDAGTRAEVMIEWHERAAIPGLTGMDSNRVDVGVFAAVHIGSDNAISLPGFVSSFTLANEKRTYNEKRQIESVDYADPVISRRYVDPFIDIPKNWRDEYHYNKQNELLGWTRVMADQPPQEFSADGRLISKRDADKNPVAWQRVRYEPVQQSDGTVSLKQVTVE